MTMSGLAAYAICPPRTSAVAAGTSLRPIHEIPGPSLPNCPPPPETSDRLFLSETEIIHLILEFLSTRKLTSTQLELERETSLINEIIPSPDLRFLRSLVLEGQWENVLEFLQPLEEAFRSFPGKKVRGTVFKYSFLDKMLTAHQSITISEESKAELLEELVKVLKDLEEVCESKEEYSSLCHLLTSPSRLAEHPEYKDWKSSTARLNAFTQLKSLVQKFIPPPPHLPSTGTCGGGPSNKVPTKISTNDRLIQLLIKGLLYETFVDYCQSKAGGNGSPSSRSSDDPYANLLRYSSLLSPDSHLSETDLSLLSWLRSLPNSTFGCPFQRRNLRVDIEPLPPQSPPKLLNVSIMDSASDLLSRSMASTSFHLSSTDPLIQSTDMKNMTTSVDRLFGDMTMGGCAVDSFHQDQRSRTSTLNNVNTSQHSQGSVICSVNHTTNKDVLSNCNSKKSGNPGPSSKAKFIPVTLLEDVQAVRCAEFHPKGHVFAIGSNSKTLRVCEYPDLSKLTENHQTYQPTILFKRTKHHKGSIYCMGWSPDGSLLATGSNDKTVKLLRFEDSSYPESNGSQEVELSMHDGTVRDICFLEDTSNKSSLLVSGGAGDCKIYITDCVTATPFQALSGHTGPILSLFNWGGAIFCSGSQDKTIRFWDIRTRGCVDIVTPLTSTASTKSPVASVTVESSGRLLISGHEDAAIVLYDIRGQRQIQSMKSHTADVRSVRFSPAAYYLLSAGYDNTLVLTDLQGDLSYTLPSVPVASHQDKVISGRWHPNEFTFLSASADKTSILWALPPD